MEALEADRCVNPEPPALLPPGLPRLDLTGPDRRELTGPRMSGFKFRGAGLTVLFLLAEIWESNLLFLNLCACFNFSNKVRVLPPGMVRKVQRGQCGCFPRATRQLGSDSMRGPGAPRRPWHGSPTQLQLAHVPLG